MLFAVRQTQSAVTSLEAIVATLRVDKAALMRQSGRGLLSDGDGAGDAVFLGE
jgi:hypothetical protein